jgi:hypothetical protein
VRLGLELETEEDVGRRRAHRGVLGHHHGALRAVPTPASRRHASRG